MKYPGRGGQKGDTTGSTKGKAMTSTTDTRTPAAPAADNSVPVKAARNSRNSGSNPTTKTAELKAQATKELTAKERKSLDALIQAVKVGYSEYTKADSAADELRIAADTSKVYVARAIARLAEHPATLAQRGTKAGTPALTKIATLVGMAASTIEPLFKAAMELKRKGMHKRIAVPKDDELAIVRGHIRSEADARLDRMAKKGKGKGTGTGGAPRTGTNVTFEALQGQLTALRESLEKFTKSNGFTAEQADDLVAGLDAAHDMIEKATAK